MRVPDEKLAEVRERGFAVVENFLDPDTLAAAQAALWGIYPRPADYFADPKSEEKFARSQFAGIRLFPYADWALSRLPVYPDLVDAAERFLSSDDIEVYKIELWAKYAGAIDYDQPHHRDFGNHTLVVPRADGVHTQMTTFILLSDVTEQDGPTKLVPLQHARDRPLFPRVLPMGELFDKEVSVTAPAGSLMIYKTDVFHRGSNFTAPGRSRFAMLIDFTQRGWRWNGKMSWPDRAGQPEMAGALSRMSVRQRDLFGFPPPGSDYWNEQTLEDVGTRYPDMDMTPYREAARAGVPG
ncbi:MAG TPA: phytanoyl-CoA dioxygenase family protein [Caulobacteraceae bacterium]|jgi:ectoine hydroxylase-related dioxygenase (phytanoyl-CoA dioxygenase family)|nr:phytanoyl-CoA dioxygenase family protein [Caulobacteraceae bacterium]